MSEHKAPRGPRGPMGGGPMGMAMPGQKSKNFKASMIKLGNFIKPYTIGIIAVLIFSVASTVFSIVGPKILGQATTEIFEGYFKKLSGTGGIDFDKILSIVITLAILYLISLSFNYISSFIMSGISNRITYRFRKDISEKINRLPLKYFDKTTHGEVLSRITNDVDLVNTSLNQSLTQIITSLTTLVGVFVMMVSISGIMTAVAVLMLPISFIVIMLVVKPSQKYFKSQQESLGELNGHIEEMYSGHLVMKAFNGEKRSIERFSAYNKKLYTSSWKSQFLSGMIMPAITFIGNISYVVICVLGGYLASNGTIKIGDIQAFIQYVRQFNQPVQQIANITNVLQSTAAAAERVFEFLDEEEQAPDGENTFKPEKVRGEVEFKNVKFGYDPEKIIINDFSSKIEPGQMIAIVGPTGAGKTTIVKILMRFYELNGGAIYVDGKDITEYSRKDLRNMFGMVLQDTWLFNGTIMDNIRYGNLDATDEQVISAAKAAHVDHFVHTLPDGYNMVLNEEASNVSQGQKQLLTIARAILSDPEILILDEATSSVDTRTEILIQKAMANLMKNRTSFVIAHRLSTIKDADKILVMDKGDIVEQGTHDELIAKNGFYANLYNSQFSKMA